MSGDGLLLDLADLAESQWGLFTTAQASEAGVTPQQLKRMADKWLLTRIRHGVYRLAGAPAAPQELIRAEWLALEPKRSAGDRLHDAVPVGVVSHRSAAWLLELGDVDADVHEFTVPRRRGTRSPDVSFHVSSLDRDDWRLVDGLPVTRPLRAAVDLAAARLDGGHLASVVRDAVLTGDASIDEFATALRPFAHRYGVRAGAGVEFVEQLIEEAGVPESASAVVAAPAARAAAMVAVPRVNALDGVAVSAQDIIAGAQYLPRPLVFDDLIGRMNANLMSEQAAALSKSIAADALGKLQSGFYESITDALEQSSFVHSPAFTEMLKGVIANPGFEDALESHVPPSFRPVVAPKVQGPPAPDSGVSSPPEPADEEDEHSVSDRTE